MTISGKLVGALLLMRSSSLILEHGSIPLLITNVPSSFISFDENSQPSSAFFLSVSWIELLLDSAVGALVGALVGTLVGALHVRRGKRAYHM